MKNRRLNTILAASALLAALAPALTGMDALAAPAFNPPSVPANIPSNAPANFADDAFKTTWTRTDALVDNGTVRRSYYWGPVPGFSLSEGYAEGPGGKRLVQYFDKSRMEVNNPNGDKTNPFYVTNGLLTRELISGQMQTGNNQYEMRYPAEIDLASDADDVGAGAPTYASFRSVTYDYGNPNRLGQTILDTINRAGLTATDGKYAGYSVKNAYYEPATKHNIPDLFWTFLNATGPVMVGGKTVNARLSDPYFYATGYPIAEAYWASVKIAGVANTAVLIQPYERRVLTYVPTAPEGFKVQMGNIGQHYYDWRYRDAGKPTPPERQCQNVPIRGFGKVWAERPDVRQQLGCSYEQERGVTVAHQYFQHGQMIDVIHNFGYGYGEEKTIYVLFEDNTVQRFQDTHKDGDPEPAVTPPPGLYTPIRGFGKVWREGTGARVRERLGWATAPATIAIVPMPPAPVPIPTAIGQPPTPVLTPTPTPTGSGGGAMQQFERGLMVYAGPLLKKIYVLYNDSGYGFYDITRWAVYDDNYTAP